MTRRPDNHEINALLRQDFGSFLRVAFAELKGGQQLSYNWHLDALIYQLNRVQSGDNRRLLICMPPRHLKSLTVSVIWVAWMLGNNPAMRFLCASYGAKLAEEFALDCLRLINSEWYRAAFPSFKLIRRTTANFKTSAGGGRLSTSVDGIGTGFGADIVIIDDPMKANAATSEAERHKVKDWFERSLKSRLEDQAKGTFIIVAQRLHEDDLPGALLEQPGWQYFKMPAIAVCDELIPLTNRRFHQRREGHALHEARLSLATLRQSEAESPFVFAPQWQQNPLPTIGQFVDPAWFGYYDEPPTVGTMTLSADTAVKVTVRNDWSVLIVARFYQNRFYILDVLRKRMTFSELQREVTRLCVEHRVERLLIEDASSGQQLIQRFSEGTTPNVPLPIAVPVIVDKTTRFEAVSSKIQSGAVVLPRAAPWLPDFISEIVAFPNGRFDDQADALAQLLANPPYVESPYPNVGPELITLYDYPDKHLGDDKDPWAAQ